MAEFPQTIADYIAGLTDEDFINGGHRSHFIPTNKGSLALALYVEATALLISEAAEQVADDAASAAAGSGTESTVEQIWAGAAAQYLSIRRAIAANAPVALAYASSIAVNLDEGRNFSLTLTGSPTLANPTGTVTPGKSGIIIVKQDATGGRALAKGSHWKVAGGSIILDPAPNAINVLAYYVESSSSILVTVSEAFS